MASDAHVTPADRIAHFLRDQESKSLLRFLTCGSVDDGKSTLIGRLLYDANHIFEDQIAALKSDSRKYGTVENDIDFALLVDGLVAEREQGITIDVAYRFFSTDKRKFIVADTPGHEEYTRNMATGASTADLAIVLIDCTKGILRQTRRHSYIASLLGIKHIVLAANKIDLLGYDQLAFDRIVADYLEVANGLGFETIQPIPVSARFGENVARASDKMPWYKGPHLLEHLETIPVRELDVSKPFRLPVQLVSRPHSDFRGFAGEIASGRVAVGDDVVVAKSGQTARITEILSPRGAVDEACEGDAVTVVFQEEIEVSRGDILAEPSGRPSVADQFQAHVIWFDSDPLMPGRSYILKTETDTMGATVTALKWEVDVNTFTHLAAKVLKMNAVGVCNFSTQMPIVFDAYRDNRATGNFILIDRLTNRTVGAGMIDFALRRAANIHWQALDIDRYERAKLKYQKPAVIWFTGLSASGKSTIANRLEKLLHSKGHHTYMLDGDNLRHGLTKDLGFTDEDRVENVRRVAEVAKLMADAGLIVLVALISPFRSERQLARDLLPAGEFVEVFVDTPLEECARRDPKGLYKKAMGGLLTNFSGITSAYEPPENPEIRFNTVGVDADELAIQIYEMLKSRVMPS